MTYPVEPYDTFADRLEELTKNIPDRPYALESLEFTPCPVTVHHYGRTTKYGGSYKIGDGAPDLLENGWEIAYRGSGSYIYLRPPEGKAPKRKDIEVTILAPTDATIKNVAMVWHEYGLDCAEGGEWCAEGGEWCQPRGEWRLEYKPARTYEETTRGITSDGETKTRTSTVHKPAEFNASKRSQHGDSVWATAARWEDGDDHEPRWIFSRGRR